MKEVRTADPTGLNGGGPHSGPYGTRDEPGGIAMEQCIEELVVRLLLLPFQLFWWAFKHDFGLLETPQEIPRKPGPALSSSTPVLWDRELDGENMEQQ